MHIQEETRNFLFFVVIGTIFSVIFDFFRAVRKVKKPKNNIVTIQDVIYFVLIGVILVLAIVNIKDEVFRLYLMLAIVLGIIMYSLIIENRIRDIFVILINSMGGIMEFIFLPLKVQTVFWSRIYKKVKKTVKLCCKKKTNMIEFYHRKVKFGKQKVRQ
ncbi:MAG: spore cortex biosynthesis protein YabQ [Clostridia bacterium]|nr:spore cortex biosynthesis protein YabQ [Clostridia bacterium]